MNANYAIYYRKTGAIDGVFKGASELAYLQRAQGYGVIQCPPETLDTTHYVDVSDWPRHVRQREALAPSVVVAGRTATVAGVPAGLEARIDGHVFETDGEPIDLTFDVPGTYRLTLDGVRWLPTTVEIVISDDD